MNAGDALVLPGYAYDGQNVRRAPGELDVRLDDAKNTGRVLATVHDVIHTYDIRFVDFIGRLPYQSGGVARDLQLFGDTGNGSTVFPKIFAYAAAFGHATLAEDGVHQRDPTNLADTYTAYFFVTRGVFRDNASYIVYSSEAGRPYDPARPAEGKVNQIGSQAVLLLYTSRGALQKYFEFRDVHLERLD